MAFKLKPPFNINGSPVYERELEEGCLGKGNKNGTIHCLRVIVEQYKCIEKICACS